MPCLLSSCDGAGCCITCVRGGGGPSKKQKGVQLPDTKACLHQGMWYFRRVVQSTTSILVPHPPPQAKIQCNVITFIYSPHPQYQLRAGATDTNTKKLMTWAASQKSWMHVCAHSPIEGIDFPTGYVCVCVCPIGGIVLSWLLADLSLHY